MRTRLKISYMLEVKDYLYIFSLTYQNTS